MSQLSYDDWVIRTLTEGRRKNWYIAEGLDSIWTWLDKNYESVTWAFDDSGESDFYQFVWYAYTSLPPVRQFFLENQVNRQAYREIFLTSD